MGDLDAGIARSVCEAAAICAVEGEIKGGGVARRGHIDRSLVYEDGTLGGFAVYYARDAEECAFFLQSAAVGDDYIGAVDHFEEVLVGNGVDVGDVRWESVARAPIWVADESDFMDFGPNTQHIYRALDAFASILAPMQRGYDLHRAVIVVIPLSYDIVDGVADDKDAISGDLLREEVPPGLLIGREVEGSHR